MNAPAVTPAERLSRCFPVRRPALKDIAIPQSDRDLRRHFESFQPWWFLALAHRALALSMRACENLIHAAVRNQAGCGARSVTSS